MNSAIVNLESQFKTITEMYKEILIIDSIKPNCNESIFSFRNSVNRTNERSPMSQKYFNSCVQYLALFRERSYHILFYDYSIARFHYEFENNKLVSYNLLWFPCPFSKDYLDICGGRQEIADMLDTTPTEESYNYDNFIFRTPVRIDFDANYKGKKKIFHPTSHLHFQHKDTRSGFKDVFCLYKFFFFVIENFYPDINYQIHNIDNNINKTMLSESQSWLKIKNVDDKELGEKIHTSFGFTIR